MRIAQIAPLAESVPPKLYGGTERVVSWLTEELVALGHDVSLFASGDSRTTAKLVPACPRALRLRRRRADPAAAYAVLLDAIAERASDFDVSIATSTGCTCHSCAGCGPHFSLHFMAVSTCRISR
jgi:Glycosyltransferase Family 4